MNILIDGQTLETEEINRGIGVYFKNVLYNMIKNTTGNVWYITVSKRESVNKLESWYAGRLNVIQKDIFAPSLDYGRADGFTKALNQVIADYNIDCLWLPNPLMVNVLLPNGKINCPFYTTVYDLIPYIMPIKEWSPVVQNEYNRRLDYLADANMICISEATQKDVMKRMGRDVNTVVTLLAANHHLFYKKRTAVNNTGHVKIVFTGGFDYRKNIYGAVEAFAKAKKMIQDVEVTLYIVCKHSREDKLRFQAKLRELGVADNVVLTGFIPDEELAELYYSTDVFFFPSLYEGFGLPLLEAMLSGAYILSADNSSLPEVCGDHAVFCNAEDVDNMAEMLVKAVHNSLEETVEDKNKRQEYALGFSWEKAAMETYRALEQAVVKEKEAARKKIAIVTPWPKQQTGIANYVYKLIPYLNSYFDVDIFADTSQEKDITLLPNACGGRYQIEELDERISEYDEVIYHMGNSAQHHSEVYKKFKKYNGIAEIHDFQLNPFFFHAYYLNGETDIYGQAMMDGYGKEGEKHFQKMMQMQKVLNGRTITDGERFPMSHSIANIAKKTIVHNEWSYHQLGTVEKAYVPLACFEKELFSENDRHKARCNICQRLQYEENEILIGTFGWINHNKRPDVILNSMKKLAEMGYKVKMAFFGQNNIENLEQEIIEAGLGNFVKIFGYLTEAEYQVGLELCNIVINLRYPTMGESSATLCEALKEGKPVIVSALNQYMEFPNDVCWKLPVGGIETDLLVDMIRYLIDHKDVREQMGQNAKVYANEVLACENIAKLYSQII